MGAPPAATGSITGTAFPAGVVCDRPTGGLPGATDGAVGAASAAPPMGDARPTAGSTNAGAAAPRGVADAATSTGATTGGGSNAVTEGTYADAAGRAPAGAAPPAARARPADGIGATRSQATLGEPPRATPPAPTPPLAQPRVAGPVPPPGRSRAAGPTLPRSSPAGPGPAPPPRRTAADMQRTRAAIWRGGVERGPTRGPDPAQRPGEAAGTGFSDKLRAATTALRDAGNDGGVGAAAIAAVRAANDYLPPGCAFPVIEQQVPEMLVYEGRFDAGPAASRRGRLVVAPTCVALGAAEALAEAARPGGRLAAALQPGTRIRVSPQAGRTIREAMAHAVAIVAAAGLNFFVIADAWLRVLAPPARVPRAALAGNRVLDERRGLYGAMGAVSPEVRLKQQDGTPLVAGERAARTLLTQLGLPLGQPTAAPGLHADAGICVGFALVGEEPIVDRTYALRDGIVAEVTGRADAPPTRLIHQARALFGLTPPPTSETGTRTAGAANTPTPAAAGAGAGLTTTGNGESRPLAERPPSAGAGGAARAAGATAGEAETAARGAAPPPRAARGGAAATAPARGAEMLTPGAARPAHTPVATPARGAAAAPRTAGRGATRRPRGETAEDADAMVIDGADGSASDAPPPPPQRQRGREGSGWRCTWSKLFVPLIRAAYGRQDPRTEWVRKLDANAFRETVDALREVIVRDGIPEPTWRNGGGHYPYIADSIQESFMNALPAGGAAMGMPAGWQRFPPLQVLAEAIAKNGAATD